MLKKLTSLFVAIVAIAALAPVTGCGDDVKKVEQYEQTHESEPEMQSSGEFVVE